MNLDFPDRAALEKKMRVSLMLGFAFLLIGSIVILTSVGAYFYALYHWTPESLRIWYAPFLVIIYTVIAIAGVLLGISLMSAGKNEVKWAERIEASNEGRAERRKQFAYLDEENWLGDEDSRTGFECEACGKDIDPNGDYIVTADDCRLHPACGEGLENFECRECGKPIDPHFDSYEEDDEGLPTCAKCYVDGAAHRGSA